MEKEVWKVQVDEPFRKSSTTLDTNLGPNETIFVVFTANLSLPIDRISACKNCTFALCFYARDSRAELNDRNRTCVMQK